MNDDLPRADRAAAPVPGDVPSQLAADTAPPIPTPGTEAADTPLAPAPTDAFTATDGADATMVATPLARDGSADGSPDVPAAAPAPAGRRGLALAAAALAAAVVIEVVVIGALLVNSGNGGSSGTAAADLGAAPVLGAARAPVLVEIWADYQCPYCGALAHVLEPSLQRDYVDTGKVRLAFRDFAFLGAESTEAAAAARCAGQQNDYWHFHDILYASQQGENQGTFAPANLMSMAKYAGLDTNVFASCMSGQSVRTAVETETAAGKALGIQSTPALRIVGPFGVKLVQGLTPLAEVEAAITEVLTGVAPSAAPGASAGPSDAPASSQSGSPASSAGPSPSGAAEPAPAASPGASTAP